MGEKRKIIVHRFAEPDPTVFDPVCPYYYS